MTDELNPQDPSTSHTPSKDPKTGRFVAGNKASVGNGANKKGRVGRPKKELKELFRKMMITKKAKRAIQTIINDPNHKHYASVLRLAMEYTVPKEAQTTKLEGIPSAPPVTFFLPVNNRDAVESVDEPTEGN